MSYRHCDAVFGTGGRGIAVGLYSRASLPFLASVAGPRRSITPYIHYTPRTITFGNTRSQLPCCSLHTVPDRLRSKGSVLSLSRRSRRSLLLQATGAFEPVRPLSPESLGPPKHPRPGLRRWGSRLLYISAVCGCVWLIDYYWYAGGIVRSLRTFRAALRVAIDYKLNFRVDPWVGGTVEDVHRRAADTLSSLLYRNGGLYLKIGQAIAMQSALLPPQFQKMFERMFDDAPQNSWREVEKVIREDFGGRSVEEIFGVTFEPDQVLSSDGVTMAKGVMERVARASASVAQVHWARLADGREVAIKIQKPEIGKQIGWDLWAWKSVMRIYTWFFDLPLYSFVPFVTERLMLETDFLNEAINGDATRRLVAAEPTLRDRVYIPTTYHELSSKRVLTTEWIEGVRLWDKDIMTGPWLGRHNEGSPGVHGASLTEFDPQVACNELRRHGEAAKLKPERVAWQGLRKAGGLGLSTADVMTTIVDLFSAQVFKWGVVHCDPHPGNIFIRRLPNGRAEVVLIDHGLYVYMSTRFRQEYSLFWTSLMTFDNKQMKAIAEGWGVKAAELFASAVLMRPYKGGSDTRELFLDSMDAKSRSERAYEMQRRINQGIRDFVANEEQFPKEILFVGRNMRIVQGNNQFLGSPVNRVKRMGMWASASLYQDVNRPLGDRLKMAWKHVVFRAVLAASDAVFYFYRFRQWIGGGTGGGMEDEIEKQMKGLAKDFGIELRGDLFNG